MQFTFEWWMVKSIYSPSFVDLSCLSFHWSSLTTFFFSPDGHFFSLRSKEKRPFLFLFSFWNSFFSTAMLLLFGWMVTYVWIFFFFSNLVSGWIWKRLWTHGQTDRHRWMESIVVFWLGGEKGVSAWGRSHPPPPLLPPLPPCLVGGGGAFFVFLKKTASFWFWALGGFPYK